MNVRDLRTPEGFARGALGHSIWHAQADIMRSVVENRRTAVKSCHASGKTFACAAIVLWWITTHKDGIAVTTAPTWYQVKTILWGEIRNAAHSHIQFPAVNDTEIRISDKNYAIGLSTNKSGRFQGFHSGRVLIVLDEAPGVREEIWSAVQGLTAGGETRILAIGNPVIIGGSFYDAFTTKRSLWSTHTINAFDTPNLARTSLEFKDDDGRNVVTGYGRDLLQMSEDELDQGTRPYLVTRRWVREMYEEWGAGHGFFQSKVLGEFPTEDEYSLIPLSWLERARVREDVAEDPEARVRAGLDVAGPGEAETVLAVTKGRHVKLIKAWPHADPRGDVLAAIAPYKAELECFNVDSVGIGWYIYLHLKDALGDIVHPVNVGEAPRDDKKYVNAKAEHFWGLRLSVQAGDLLGLADEKTIGQLSAIRYKHNARGQVEIESKDDMRKRGVKSPDRAEALMLAKARVRAELTVQMFPVMGVERASPWRMGGNT